MSNQQHDVWELGDAPVLGEGIVTISDAQFGYDAQYMGGETELLILEGKVVDDHGETYEWRKLYPIGKGWSVVDRGSRIESENGRPKKIMRSSKYGLWMQGAFDSGAGEYLKDKSPLEASTWTGLTFEVRGVEVDYGKEIGKKPVLVPVKYLGAGGAAASTASSSPAPAPATYEMTGSVRAKLTKLAVEADSHEIFYNRAFVEIPEVDEHMELGNAVADSPDLYLELRGDA